MSLRIERANSELQRCISYIIQNKLNDPRIEPLLYVSEVKVTPDYKYCKIKIALDTEDKNKLKDMVAILTKSSGFIKKELSQMVKMRYMPQLIFEIDKGTQATIRINEILKTIKIPKEDNDD